jgi:hypothetical protein
MNRHLAHLLRRTARKLIAWSNRLDAPADLNDPDLRAWLGNLLAR